MSDTKELRQNYTDAEDIARAAKMAARKADVAWRIAADAALAAKQEADRLRKAYDDAEEQAQRKQDAADAAYRMWALAGGQE